MCVVVPLKIFLMNYCMSVMYDIGHGVSGGYAVPPGGRVLHVRWGKARFRSL